MSYDLLVYCVLPHGDDLSARGRGWAIAAPPSITVEPEDVPEDVTRQLPGIRHLVELNLSPIGDGGAGLSTLQKVARKIAKACRGVIVDPQSDTTETPTGVTRYARPKRATGAPLSQLQMSWWMDDDVLTTPDGIARFLDVLEHVLPEAMPRRYGSFEPPQHRLDRDGRAHLESFLARERHMPVLYTTAPVSHLTLARRAQRDAWAHPLGYRASHVAIQCDAAVLDQPGWADGIARAFRQLSMVLRPFYGEARTLRGYVAKGGRIFSGRDTERHPVKVWWWKGVPPLAHAVVIGAPYRALWPELDAIGSREGALCFVATSDWRTTVACAEVPTRLAAPPEPESSPRTFSPEQFVAHIGAKLTATPVAPVFPFAPPG